MTILAPLLAVAIVTPAHVVNSFDLTVALSYGKAAALFGPEGERPWAGPTWNPQFIYPQPARDQQGAVFTIAHGDHTAIWSTRSLTSTRTTSNTSTSSPKS